MKSYRQSNKTSSYRFNKTFARNSYHRNFYYL